MSGALTVALVLRMTVTRARRPPRAVDMPRLPMFNRMPGARRMLWGKRSSPRRPTFSWIARRDADTAAEAEGHHQSPGSVRTWRGRLLLSGPRHCPTHRRQDGAPALVSFGYVREELAKTIPPKGCDRPREGYMQAPR